MRLLFLYAALGHRLRHDLPAEAPHGHEPRGRAHEVPHWQALRERAGAPAGAAYPTSRALGLRFASRLSASRLFASRQPGDRRGGGARSFRHLAPVDRPHGLSEHPLFPRRSADRQTQNKYSTTPAPKCRLHPLGGGCNFSRGRPETRTLYIPKYPGVPRDPPGAGFHLPSLLAIHRYGQSCTPLYLAERSVASFAAPLRSLIVNLSQQGAK